MTFIFFFSQIQLNINLAVILKLICQTFASIIPFLVICNATEHLHSRFDEIDIIARCDWYTFPIKIRRIFPIIIQNSQKMDFLNVFGNITVSRETCKLVIQSNFNSNKIVGSLSRSFFSSSLLYKGGSKRIFNLYHTSSILKVAYI